MDDRYGSKRGSHSNPPSLIERPKASNEAQLLWMTNPIKPLLYSGTAGPHLNATCPILHSPHCFSA